MRQVCNVTYAYLTEGLTMKDRQKIDRELLARGDAPVSHGTRELFALMGGPRRPPEPEG